MFGIKRWATIAFFVLGLSSTAQAQGYGVGTPVEAKRMVVQATEYLRAHGAEKTLNEINKRNGKFQWRDLYVFAYDLDGVMRGHPSPGLIGKNMFEEPDVRGKRFRKDIVEIAGTRGSAWVDYTYINPRTQQDETKITYCAKEVNLILCCGAYLP